MKTFLVSVTTTYDGQYEVQANSLDEAMDLVDTRLVNGEFDPTSDFTASTDVHYAEEQETA